MSGIDWWRWRDRVFQVAVFGGLQFVVVSLIAMLLYAGGNSADLQAAGYHFFRNFFSDLGLTMARNGQTNTLSAILFLVSLTAAGSSLILFFLFIPRLLAINWFTWLLTIAGSIAGVLSGIGFIGVALNPADLNLTAHVNSVFLAFIAFLAAVVCHMTVIFINRAYPNSMGFLYLLFAVVLAGYIYLLFWGPSTDTLRGLTIQVAGQKAVVYAAIISVTIQAYRARQLMARNLAGIAPVAVEP